MQSSLLSGITDEALLSIAVVVAMVAGLVSLIVWAVKRQRRLEAELRRALQTFLEMRRWRVIAPGESLLGFIAPSDAHTPFLRFAGRVQGREHELQCTGILWESVTSSSQRHQSSVLFRIELIVDAVRLARQPDLTPEEGQLLVGVESGIPTIPEFLKPFFEKMRLLYAPRLTLDDERLVLAWSSSRSQALLKPSILTEQIERGVKVIERILRGATPDEHE